MYIKEDRQRLKTKIIATMGSEDRSLYDLQGQKCDNVKYETLFQWFKQPHQDCCMVDILRLNMAFYSNKNQGPYQRIFNWLKQEQQGLAKNVGVLCDLAGAKTRLGKIRGGKVKVKGDFQLSLKDNKPGDKTGASVFAYGKPLKDLANYHDIRSKIKECLDPHTNIQGLRISVGDGKTILKADRVKNDILYCKVEKEGVIKSNWGITFEELDLGLPSFQKSDQDALDFILKLDNDQGFLSHIGVSFVRRAKDIWDVRRYVENYFIDDLNYTPEDARLRCPDIIAKIETEKGAENINSILDVADGAMIARGDLALQLGREQVPQKQKEIISLCNRRGKVVITATEMLASMEDNPKPTRAEVNDVFNAIMDGTDAVMLSGETSSGEYPAQAVEFMVRIADKAETYYEKLYARKSPLNTQRIQNLRLDSENLVKEAKKWLENIKKAQQKSHNTWAEKLYKEIIEKNEYQDTTDRICAAACELAEEEEFKAIVASTASGRTVRMLSRFRPSVKLIGVIYDERCRRRMLMSYGAYPLTIGDTPPATGTSWQNPEEVFKKAAEDCKTEQLSQIEDHVIFVSGTPLGKYGQGKVNILQIKEIV